MLPEAQADKSTVRRLQKRWCSLHKPCEECSEQPGQQADDQGARLRADVAGLEGLAYRVVTFEADGQYGEHGGVSHCQLHKRHHLTCNTHKQWPAQNTVQYIKVLCFISLHSL